MATDAEQHRPAGRRESRQHALEILYEADVRREGPRRSLDRADAGPFTRRLVAGVADHLADIDRLLGETSHGWPVARMATVDRNLLRLATYELLHEDTPPAVVISEAVELAKLLSTDSSPRFVNGILSAVHRRPVEPTDGGSTGT